MNKKYKVAILYALVGLFIVSLTFTILYLVYPERPIEITVAATLILFLPLEFVAFVFLAALGEYLLADYLKDT